MARFAKATWIGPTPNRNAGQMGKPIGLVLHVMQGTEAGSESWLRNPKAQASAHFCNPQKGSLRQLVDTADKAWAQMAGNSQWISVEHEGYADKPPAPTASQVENDAQLLAWLHKQYAVPLQITDSPSKGGLGWHGMGGTAWGSHFDCPGDRIKHARPAIINRAKQIVKEQSVKGLSKATEALTKHLARKLKGRADKGTPLTAHGKQVITELVKQAQRVEKA